MKDYHCVKEDANEQRDEGNNLIKDLNKKLNNLDEKFNKEKRFLKIKSQR